MSAQFAKRRLTGPLEECCGRFQAGKLDHASENDIRHLLRGEGVKRLDSFVFELLLQRALTHYCEHMPVALGWYVLTRNEADADCWIRLETESTLNSCDDALIALLSRRNCTILKVRPSTGNPGFQGCWYSGQHWQEERELGELLRERSKYFGAGLPGRVRQPEPAPPERANAALDRLFRHSTPSERRSLALSRLLINCFIVPYTGQQPMDLDAIILNDKLHLRFVEFKRKYPSRAGKFGLDSGHGILIRWLDVSGHKLSNVVLVDPCWNKYTSPFHILDEPTRTHIRWLGAHIDPSLFDPEGLTTRGEDSGMYPEQRDQEAVVVSRYMNLGAGFTPKGLKAFLNDAESLPSASMRELANVRQAARQDGSCPEIA